MFKNALLITPLYNEAANEYFDDIIAGQPWQRDVTFVSTLRALLAPRMKEGDRLDFVCTSSNYNKEQLQDFGANRAVRMVSESWVQRENEIHIHNFQNYSQEDNEAWLKVVEESFEGVAPGWHRLEKVTVFFRKVFNVLCFINPDQKSVVLFTVNIDIRRMHYLQCGIFAFLPWYFDPEKGVTEEEMNLINSLREKTSEKYEECLKKIAEKYDFQTARIRRLLKGFETRYEQVQCDRIRNEIDSILRNLQSLDQQIADFLRRKRDAEANLLGLEMKVAEGGEDSEIMDYFLCHKNLLLQTVSGSTMQFIVSTTLDYFDEDMAARVINNKRSFLYIDGYGDEVRNGQISAADMKNLMTEIFINQSLRIRVCAAYQFRLEGTITSIGGYDYGPEFKDFLPNPHIDRFRCLGNYERIINGRLKDHDYIGAIEQCTASCKSLNFGDGAVMREFTRKIYGNSGNTSSKFIEDLDGNQMTVKEAVAWIKAKASAPAENENA